MEVRRAEWRLREGERWTFWRLMVYWIDRTPALERAGFLFMGACALVAIRLNSPVPMVYALPVPVLMLLFRRRPIPRSLRDLALQPSDLPQHAVAIDVHHRGHRIGADDGVLTVVDGWLHFEGLRTSFSLKPLDVHEYDDSWASFCGVKLTMTDENGNTKLAISSLSSRSDLSTGGRRASNFLKDLKAWKEESRIPEGESMFPPCTIHPMAEAGWRFYPVSRFCMWLVIVGLFLRKPEASGKFDLFYWSLILVLDVFQWALKLPHRRKLAMAKPTLPAIADRQEEERCLTTKI